MLPSLAFLGPTGTYSHQAAYDRFGDAVRYCGKPTISSIYDALRDECSLGLVPQQNSIYGIVIETYDLCRGSAFGRGLFVRDEVTLGIQHCLLVQEGTKLEDITRLLSHEQALGQCSRFIDQHLDGASQVKTTSTMAAVEAVLSDKTRTSAAIASKLSVTLFNGLQLLREGIQDEASNFTRFYVLAKSIDTRLPCSPSCVETRPARALFRMQFSGLTVRDDVGLVTLTRLLDALQLRVTHVDRRPCLGARSLDDDIYFIEVEEEDDHASKLDGSGVSSVPWDDQLKAAEARVVNLGGDIVLLGRW